MVAPKQAAQNSPAVSAQVVHEIISERCSVCHSDTPSYPGFTSPPGGFVLDTIEQISQKSAQIEAQAITTKAMPLGNITQMTQAERDQIAAWISAGKPE